MSEHKNDKYTAVNHVFIADGPGYTVANDLGYITLHGNNSDSGNVSVNLSSVPGSGNWGCSECFKLEHSHLCLHINYAFHIQNSVYPINQQGATHPYVSTAYKFC